MNKVYYFVRPNYINPTWVAIIEQNKNNFIWLIEKNLNLNVYYKQRKGQGNFKKECFMAYVIEEYDNLQNILSKYFELFL